MKLRNIMLKGDGGHLTGKHFTPASRILYAEHVSEDRISKYELEREISRNKVAYVRTVATSPIRPYGTALRVFTVLPRKN
jgi:hypothetical protein